MSENDPIIPGCPSIFPHEIVTRFFTGKYDDESCRRIAH
jgi:hypothetical protein